MDKRTVFALILCLVILFGYQMVYRTIYPPPPPTENPISEAPPEPEAQESTESTSEAQEPQTTPPDGEVTSEDNPEPSTETLFPQTPKVAEIETVFDSPKVKVVLTNVGASIERLYLKEFSQESGLDGAPEANWVVLLSEFQDGHRSLQMLVPGSDLESAVWERVSYDPGENRAVFRYQPGNGLTYEKSFFLPPDRYDIELEISIKNENAALKGIHPITLVGSAGIHREGIPWDPKETVTEGDSVVMMGRQGGQAGMLATGTHDGALKVDQISSGDVAEKPVMRSDENLQWIGVHDFYFASVLDGHGNIPLDHAEFELLKDWAYGDPLPAKDDMERSRVQCQFSLNPVLPAVGADDFESIKVSLYTGPKSRSVFNQEEYKRYQVVMEAGRTYCIFPSYIVEPIVALFSSTLILFHSWFGSFGFAIILLTLIVRVLMLPITLKQQSSMAKFQKNMAKVKPELDKLKEKYKGNSKKMNEEQMALFKKKGVTPVPPLGGCLPMLITMPVFIGMFYTFGMSIELRHTSFLWITDLAQPDRLAKNPFPFSIGCIDLTYINILPLIMSATWVLQGRMQQKNMPTNADPQMAQQQKMMAYMPVMFGFILYNYASGVHLYQFTSSLLGILEAKYVRKHFLPKDEPEPETPVKGKLKGGGKGGGKSNGKDNGKG